MVDVLFPDISGNGKGVVDLDFTNVTSVKSLDYFGVARYKSIPEANAGVSSTSQLQDAIDWCYEGGVAARALILDGIVQCSNIDMHPTVTLLGSSRQSCGFTCEPGTSGIWFNTPVSAQKIILNGLLFYGNNNDLLTHVMRLVQGQHGTEGIIRDCWFREAPEGYALEYSGNVGYIHDCTFQECKVGLKAIGNANRYSSLSFMRIGRNANLPWASGIVPIDPVALDLSGGTLDGFEIEAPVQGTPPIKLRGDSHLRNGTLSMFAGDTFSHLIEVDDSAFKEWSVTALNILNHTAFTTTNGVYKIGSVYRDNNVDARGRDYVSSLNIHQGDFLMKGMKHQAFRVRITNTGGTPQHRIGAITDSSAVGNFHDRITGASNVLQNTPTGADASTAFVAGAKRGSAVPSYLVLDTAEQIVADGLIMASIQVNTTTVDLTVWPQFQSFDVNGVTRRRLVLQLLNATTGAAFSLASIGIGQTVDIVVTGPLY